VLVSVPSKASSWLKKTETSFVGKSDQERILKIFFLNIYFFSLEMQRVNNTKYNLIMEKGKLRLKDQKLQKIKLRFLYLIYDRNSLNLDQNLINRD
jgi:hypothetical protein